MLAHVADGFTAAAVGTGLYAALLWWGSARVPLDPDFTTPDPIYDQLSGTMGVLARTIAAVAANVIKASGLNRRAAKWTAASVALQAVATVLGRLAML